MKKILFFGAPVFQIPIIEKAKEMGYARILTYTLVTEPGTSLKASGWKDMGEAGGGSWSVPSRPRDLTQTSLFGEEQKYPTCKKRRWEKRFKE